jgi:hypothetical protein
VRECQAAVTGTEEAEAEAGGTKPRAFRFSTQPRSFPGAVTIMTWRASGFATAGRPFAS